MRANRKMVLGNRKTATTIQIVMPLVPARRNGRRFVNPVPTSVGGLSVMFKVGPQFFFGAAARSPRQPLGPFHTDARIYSTHPKSGLRIMVRACLIPGGNRWRAHSHRPVWDERAAPRTGLSQGAFEPPIAPKICLYRRSDRSHASLRSPGSGHHSTPRPVGKLPAARWITTLGVGDPRESWGRSSRCTELN
jgi:hypothetical protein